MLHTLQTDSPDIIIAGAGLSGLTLALELARRPYFAGKKILLLDRDSKQYNDRTWCFWATADEPLPPVVLHTWEHCRFYGTGFEKRMNIAPYRYCLIRGIDFYRWAHHELDKSENIRRIQTRITGMDATNGTVHTEAGVFKSDLIFNSAFTSAPVTPPASADYPDPPLSVAPGPPLPWDGVRLLQHFKGWLIRTEQPAFDPAAMTFMDFRIDQEGETRFVYVLPFSTTRALVEFTVFSPALLEAGAYTVALQQYLERYLNCSGATIEAEEFGVIPMTAFPFPHRREGAVIHIGTAGGFVKASSGYAFKRTQRKIAAFADAWARTGAPDPSVLRSPFLFRAFDDIFLRVLGDNNALGSLIFQRLFEKLPPALVLRFLDEDTTFAGNLRLISAPPTMPFLRAFFQQLLGLFRI